MGSTSIDRVLAEATKAHAVALARKGESPPAMAKPPGEWTRLQPALDEESDDPIWRALRDV